MAFVDARKLLLFGSLAVLGSVAFAVAVQWNSDKRDNSAMAAEKLRAAFVHSVLKGFEKTGVNGTSAKKSVVQTRGDLSGRTAVELEDQIRSARRSGDAAKLFSLAQRFEKGNGTNIDLRRAEELYIESAKLGDRRAMMKAGEFAQKGIAGLRRPDDATNWYEKAGEAGEPDAYARLARMYMDGRLMPADTNAAQNYVDLGVQAGSADALFLKGVLLMNPPAAPENALHVLADAALRGSADAQALISRLYSSGNILPKDASEAIEWARLGAAEGSTTAAVDLARLLLSDTHGDAASTSEAADNLLHAEDNNSAPASWELAKMEMSRGSSANMAQVKAEFLQAYSSGSSAAAFGLALSALSDPAEGETAARDWLTKGSARGDWRSQYVLDLVGSGNSLAGAIDVAAGATREQFMQNQQKSSAATPGVTLPVPLKTPAPKIPAALAVMGFQATVYAEFVVGADGAPTGINLYGASQPQLEQAVQETLAQWRYQPASRNGGYYAQRIRLPFHFRAGF